MGNKNTGLSLIEFVVSLALLAVGALMTAPLYYKLADNVQASSYTNQLIATLTQARVHAVKRALPVTVCSSADGYRCTATPWAHGYIAFVDNGQAGMVNEGDVVIHRRERSQSKAVVTLEGGRYVRFYPTGTLYSQARDSGTEPPQVQSASWARWLERLSPLGTAHADDAILIADDEPSDTSLSEGAVSRGVFMVCVRSAGRQITLALTGRVTSTVVACRKS